MRLCWASVFLSVTIAACGNNADLSPSEIKELNPTGQWVRKDGRPIGLLIMHDPRGAWIVESLGKAVGGQARNACWRVHAGSLNGSELVASSDASRDNKDRLTRDNTQPPEGLFLDFKREFMTVSGPEAVNNECPLEGDYIRRSGEQPTRSYQTSQMPGPTAGDPSSMR